MNDAVELSIVNGVADLRLNRPDKMNAVDEGIMTGLREAHKISKFPHRGAGPGTDRCRINKLV